MNASLFHSNVRVSLVVFVAGNDISGKMEMECKTDTGLGIGIMMVEPGAARRSSFLKY